MEQFGPDIRQTTGHFHRRPPELAREQRCNFFNRNPTGKFTGLRAPHSITDRKDKIQILGRRFPVLAQIMNFLGIKLNPQKCVLIIGPDLATIRLAKPLQAFGGGG